MRNSHRKPKREYLLKERRIEVQVVDQPYCFLLWLLLVRCVLCSRSQLIQARVFLSPSAAGSARARESTTRGPRKKLIVLPISCLNSISVSRIINPLILFPANRRLHGYSACLGFGEP